MPGLIIIRFIIKTFVWLIIPLLLLFTSLPYRCSLPSLAKRHVAIARLKHAANMGRNSHEVRFFVLVVTPSKEVWQQKKESRPVAYNH